MACDSKTLDVICQGPWPAWEIRGTSASKRRDAPGFQALDLEERWVTQLGKLLKKGKNLPDKYDDHLQEHRRMTRYSKKTLNYHQLGLMRQLRGTNEYLGRSWE